MADVKDNYVSKYSGDQLDAAIAALGSLGTLFIKRRYFKEFVHLFEEAMGDLTNDVSTITEAANGVTAMANTTTTKAGEAVQRALDASVKVDELSQKPLIQYEEIVKN